MENNKDLPALGKKPTMFKGGKLKGSYIIYNPKEVLASGHLTSFMCGAATRASMSDIH